MVAEHITNLPSDKDSGTRPRTQMLVVHSAETPLLPGYAVSVTKNWLNVWYRPDGSLIEASINTFFGPDTTVRSVNTFKAAWHATWANALSVGYEFTGYAALTRAQWLTDLGVAMLDRAGREMAADAELFGIPLRWLTTAEVSQIKAGNTTIKGLATHRQIDPVNRTDPGDGFPYDVLLANILRYAGKSPTPPKPTPPKGPEVKHARIAPSKKFPRILGKDKPWWLKQEKGGYNENQNYAALGVGLYMVDLYLEGEGLPKGGYLDVMFEVVTGSNRSPYYPQRVFAAEDGTVKGNVRFSTPIKGARLEVRVTPSADCHLTHYGADVTLGLL